MHDSAQTAWKIAVTGSSSVGKTSLVEMLASTLGLPRIEEEMRIYLERTKVRLSELPALDIAPILLNMWRARSGKEQNTRAFVADNCSLDFIAYALHYGCLTENTASILVPEVLNCALRYDAIFVLPWGVIPYVRDGIRSSNRFGQLGYQFIIEGLLRRYVEPQKIHHLPADLKDLDLRSRWACSVLGEMRVPPKTEKA